MRRALALSLLLLATAAGPTVAGALEYRSQAALCPKGSETWVCSRSWTQANAFEAVLFDEVTVEGQFFGPDYSAVLQDGSDIFLAIVSTWRAEVLYDRSCAFSGLHSAGGVHFGLKGDPNIAGGIGLPISGPHYTYDYYYNFYCNCGSTGGGSQDPP